MSPCLRLHIECSYRKCRKHISTLKQIAASILIAVTDKNQMRSLSKLILSSPLPVTAPSFPGVTVYNVAGRPSFTFYFSFTSIGWDSHGSFVFWPCWFCVSHVCDDVTLSIAELHSFSLLQRMVRHLLEWIPEEKLVLIGHYSLIHSPTRFSFL